MPGSEVTCRAKSCTAGVATLPALCDGSGSCSPIETKACEPYRCGDLECTSSCTSDADCASDYRCEAFRCVASGVCDGDHTVVFSDRTADCAPFTCDGELDVCRETCASTGDCVRGYVCSGSQCVATSEASAADQDGGCAVRPGRTRAAAFVLLLAAVSWARRRSGRVRGALQCRSIE